MAGEPQRNTQLLGLCASEAHRALLIAESQAEGTTV